MAWHGMAWHGMAWQISNILDPEERLIDNLKGVINFRMYNNHVTKTRI